jgi:hypothetical protein
MREEIDSLLKGTAGFSHPEDLAIEAVRDLIKDEIKKYIAEKLKANPELKKEFKAAVEEFIEAKIKEALALIKVGKCAAKLGLELVPSSLKEEVTKDIISLFEKEINMILDRTL